MDDSFKTSKIKVKAATRHANSLESVINQYRSSNPISLVLQPSETFLRDEWTLFINAEPPEDLAVYIGDCIHNLRAALDVMAVTLVGLNGGNINNVYFPFANEAVDLEGMIKRKNFNRAHPDAVDLVRKLKPYKGGNTALRAMHDFDIADKHVGFIPTTAVSEPPGLRHGPVIMIGNKLVEPKSGQIMISAPPDFNHKLYDRLSVQFALEFPYESVFSQMEVVPTMRKLIDDVEGIIQAFETLAFGNAA